MIIKFKLPLAHYEHLVTYSVGKYLHLTQPGMGVAHNSQNVDVASANSSSLHLASIHSFLPTATNLPEFFKKELIDFIFNN